MAKMYRVFLVPTDESPQKELWLEAHEVHETDGGACFEFVDEDNNVLRRLDKSAVKAIEITPDRRRARVLEDPEAQEVPSIVRSQSESKSNGLRPPISSR